MLQADAGVSYQQASYIGYMTFSREPEKGSPFNKGESLTS